MDGWIGISFFDVSFLHFAPLCCAAPVVVVVVGERASDGEESVDHLRCGWHTHAKYGAEK
jgi:hypothetical protein